MLPVGFEPTISAGERPQTYALDRAATGTGSIFYRTPLFYYFKYEQKVNKLRKVYFSSKYKASTKIILTKIDEHLRPQLVFINCYMCVSNL